MEKMDRRNQPVNYVASFYEGMVERVLDFGGKWKICLAYLIAGCILFQLKFIAFTQIYTILMYFHIFIIPLKVVSIALSR